MQEKLAEMKSKFLTKVAIRVKPAPNPSELQHEEHFEPFNVLNSGEMGLAKQIVFNDHSAQTVAAADVITKPSDS